MKRVTRAIVVTLLAAPLILIFCLGGLLFLWENAWLWKWLWLPTIVSWGLAWGIYRWGRRKFGLIWQPDAEVAMHWTSRDQEAWQAVEQFVDESDFQPGRDSLEPDYFFAQLQQLARRLAHVYTPDSTDLMAELTVPEILTAAELAISDLRTFIDENIPGSHLLTVGRLQQIAQVPKWWNRLRPLRYAFSAIRNPWSTIYRVAADGAVGSPVVQDFQRDGVTSLYRLVMLQAGKHLIELYSHRLRVGPERWREVMRSESGSTPGSAGPITEGRPSSTRPSNDENEEPLRIAVIGQVKAGKSSLINVILGRQQAAADCLPLTRTVTEYRLPGGPQTGSLSMLDTVGYGQETPPGVPFEAAISPARDAALVILVLKATEPARKPDRDCLEAIHSWYEQRSHLRPPVVLAVLSHIDLLPPATVWEPPYQGWLEPYPTGGKNQSIREAVEYNLEVLGDLVDSVVPVCTDREHQRVYGVQQWVLPAILNLWPQAQSKRLIDLLYADGDRHRAARLFSQLRSAATKLGRMAWKGLDGTSRDADHDSGEPDGSDTGER